MARNRNRMALLNAIDFTLFADFYQFYLQDESIDQDWSESWDQEATELMSAIAAKSVQSSGSRRR